MLFALTNGKTAYIWSLRIYDVYVYDLYTAYSAIPTFNPISPLPHASFSTYEILVHLKTGVSNKRNKRHLATTLT